jgi:glycerol-3-phosphate dehydrogenase
VDEVRRVESPRAAPIVRLSKGVNVFLRSNGDWSAALALFDRTRSVVAVPYYGLLVVGATDTPFDGDPGLPTSGPADVDALLESLRGLVDDDVISRDRVVAVTAGLRALERGCGETSAAPRDVVLSTGPGGVVSVAGGKLTTHRLIAMSVLASLPAGVRPRDLRPSNTSLVPRWTPGANDAADPATVDHLVSLYGGAVAELPLDDDGLAPIVDGGRDVRAQLRYARDEEWALSVDDVVRRRTTLELHGLATPAVRVRIGAELGLPQFVTTDGVGATSPLRSGGAG